MRKHVERDAFRAQQRARIADDRRDRFVARDRLAVARARLECRVRIELAESGKGNLETGEYARVARDERSLRGGSGRDARLAREVATESQIFGQRCAHQRLVEDRR